MYAVVGCTDCQALWVITTDGETASCPRCGRRHRLDRLEQFVTTPEEDHAREVRSAMLAERQGESEAFAKVDDFETLGERSEQEAVPDETYLAASGIDPEPVAEAGERATEQGDSLDRRGVVEEALRALDEPTAEDVATRAAESGVPPETARSILERLVADGAATQRDGVYRLL
jgi:hypothetical protein